MSPTTRQLAAALLISAISPVVQSSLLIAAAAAASTSKLSGICTSRQPGFCIRQMTVSYSTGYSSYCSSLQTHSTTTNVAGATSTITLPVTTITGDPTTITTDTTITQTVCGATEAANAAPNHAFFRANVNKAGGKTTPSPVPSQLSKCIRTNIPAACSCLGFTITTITSTVVASDVTVTQTPTPGTSTVTPTITSMTGTQTSTVTIGGTFGTPTVILASPTPLTGVDSNGLAVGNYDDTTFTLNLPFAVSLYGTSDSSIDISINGWIALVQGQSYSAYQNGPLPQGINRGYDGLPNVAFAPYWNDLYVYAGTAQGIYYQIVGDYGNRSLSVEWYTSLYGNSNGYYHFIATLYEALPGAATYAYEANGQADSEALLGTIGVQQDSTNNFAQYSYNTAVTPGTELQYDPLSNTFIDTTAVTCAF